MIWLATSRGNTSARITRKPGVHTVVVIVAGNERLAKDLTCAFQPNDAILTGMIHFPLPFTLRTLLFNGPDPTMEAVFIVAGVGFVGVSVLATILWSLHSEKKRVADMRTVAESLGLAFFEKGHEQLLSRLQRFQLFNSGRGRSMKNVILGETEVATIAIFDYQYTTGNGKNQTTYVQTVVSMESASLELPSFTMRPEHLFDRVGSALGLQDIDFAEHPEFSKSFVLKGENEEAIREFFDTPLLNFFATRPGIYFECAPGMFIYFRAGKRQKVVDLRKYLEDGYSVYQAFVERLSRK